MKNVLKTIVLGPVIIKQHYTLQQKMQSCHYQNLLVHVHSNVYKIHSS